MAFFGNLMNNYFYGKSGKGDYRIEDMPQNRFQLFGAVLKTRWSALVGVNLLYVLFWLPAAAWTLLNYITLVSGAAENVTGLFSTYLRATSTASSGAISGTRSRATGSRRWSFRRSAD